MSSAQQSPINLRSPVYADLGDDRLVLEWEGEVGGMVIKEKEGVKVQVFSEGPQRVRLGGKTYRLASFHFHHPSEHLIDGEPYSVELHLVHRNVDDGTSYAVIGVFVELADVPGETALQTFLKDVAKILNHPAGSAVSPMVTVDPRIFLPERPEDYYRYEGSLTTLGFTENVSWVVMREARRVNVGELRELIKEFEKPARDPQPLNRRFVLSTFRPDEALGRASEGAAPSSKPQGQARSPKAPKKKSKPRRA